MHEAGQVADQRPVRHQRALGRAGGAAGVDEQRRIVGRGCHGGERGRRLLRAGDPSRCASVSARAADADHVLAGAAGARGSRTGCASVVARRWRPTPPLCCMRYSSASGPNRMRQRQRDRAHLEDRDVARSRSRDAAAGRSPRGRRASRPGRRARSTGGWPRPGCRGRNTPPARPTRPPNPARRRERSAAHWPQQACAML